VSGRFWPNSARFVEGLSPTLSCRRTTSALEQPNQVRLLSRECDSYSTMQALVSVLDQARIMRHAFIGFLCNRKRHPQLPFVWMST
jgi:hypothetical protein